MALARVEGAAAQWRQGACIVQGQPEQDIEALLAWARFAEGAAATLEQAAAAAADALARAPAIMAPQGWGCSLSEAAELVYVLASMGPSAAPFVQRAAAAAAELAPRARAAAVLQAATEGGEVLTHPDEGWRRLAWACAIAGYPRPDVFGQPSVVASRASSAAVWRALLSLAERARDVEAGHSIQALAHDPFPLLWLRGWLSETEAGVLAEAAATADAWSPSPLAVPLGETPFRTSESATLTPEFLPLATAATVEVVCARAAALVGVSVSHVEPLQLVRYTAGRRYHLHMDWAHATDPSLWVVGQRVATVLVYLTDVPAGVGGCTRFPRLCRAPKCGCDAGEGLRLRPERCAAAVWPNVDAFGRPMFDSEHEAEPLAATGAALLGCSFEAMEVVTKVAMNIWIRDQPIPWSSFRG